VYSFSAISTRKDKFVPSGQRRPHLGVISIHSREEMCLTLQDENISGGWWNWLYYDYIAGFNCPKGKGKSEWKRMWKVWIYIIYTHSKCLHGPHSFICNKKDTLLKTAGNEMNQKNNNDNKNEGNKGQNSTKTLKYCNCNGEGHFAKYCKKTKKDKTQMP